MYKLTVFLINIILIIQNATAHEACVAPETKIDSKFLVLDIGKLCECNGFVRSPLAATPGDGKDAVGCDIKLPPNTGLSVSVPIEDLCKCAGYTNVTMVPRGKFYRLPLEPTAKPNATVANVTTEIETHSMTTKKDSTLSTVVPVPGKENSTEVPESPESVTTVASPIMPGKVNSTEVPETPESVTTVASPMVPGKVNSTEVPETPESVTTVASPIMPGKVNSTEVPETPESVTTVASIIVPGKVNSTEVPETPESVTTVASPMVPGEVNSTEVPETPESVTTVASPIVPGKVNSTEVPETPESVTTVASPIISGEVNSTEVPETPESVTTVASPRILEEVNSTAGEMPTTLKPVSVEVSTTIKGVEGGEIVTTIPPDTIKGVKGETVEKPIKKDEDKESHEHGRHDGDDKFATTAAKSKGSKEKGETKPYPTGKILLILFVSLLLGLIMVLISKFVYNHFRTKTYVIPPGNMQNMELGNTNCD